MTEIEQLQNEVFCLKYELQTFAEDVTRGKLERWIKGFSSITIEDSHIKRYKIANGYVKDKVILDMASGSGYGTSMLAKEGLAKEIIAVDIDVDAVKYASIRNAHQRISFLQGDATNFCRPNYFDVIISFETIEHLPSIESYLTNINISLKKDGRFIVSTPVSSIELNTKPANEFHVQEWGFYRFQQEVAKYVNIEKVFIQAYPVQSKNIFKRVINKLFSTAIPPGFSSIEEYNPVKHKKLISVLGKRTYGYQILICNKK